MPLLRMDVNDDERPGDTGQESRCGGLRDINLCVRRCRQHRRLLSLHDTSSTAPPPAVKIMSQTHSDCNVGA